MENCAYCNEEITDQCNTVNYGACLSCYENNNEYECSECGVRLDRNLYQDFQGRTCCEECYTELNNNEENNNNNN